MSPDDAYALLRKHCRSKKNMTEEYPWGDVVWKVRGKIFAGSSDGSNRVTVKSTPDEQARLIEHPAIEKAKYVGRFGWVSITVTSKQTSRLALELIDQSYDSIAAGKSKRKEAVMATSTKTTRLRVVPLTPERWSDFEHLFGPRGACGGCWCMTPRLTSSKYEKNKGAGNRRAMRRLVRSGKRPPGLLAYLGREVVGWCSIEPREVFGRLARSRILKPVDDKPVWSIVCFFIAKEHREKGLSVELIQGAVRYARSRGARIVEAYPVEPKKKPMPAVFAWSGIASAFRRAGFKEVARRSETRPIVRRVLRPRS